MPTLTQPSVGGNVIDAIGRHLAEFRVDEIMDANLSGLPSGCHSRPPFLKSPTSSFFLVSTEITGSPAAWNWSAPWLDVLELGVTVGMRLPSRVLRSTASYSRAAPEGRTTVRWLT